MIKLVSFDIWGTLLDLNLMLEAIVEELSYLSSLEKTFIDNAFKKARKESRELRLQGKLPAKEAVNICQKLFADTLGLDVEFIKRAVVKATLKVRKHIGYPVAIEVLKTVKEKELFVCTIGNVQFWSSNYTRIFIEETGFANYIDKQFYSDEVGVFKPEKEIFIHAASYFKVKPEEMIHVGDREKEDFFGAQKAGVNAFLLKKPEDLKHILEFI
ncbi:HAD family hydrolase [Desulfurobacterium sp.]|uniref:HAD family hydrolase n=1 Tax=Desulfurobacterium sp. TaxID=2004706 RepID=UPI0026391065|nr:HAD family hydrolase [Desulfurobacterium sp.]